MIDWLIDYLRFYVPLKNISLIWRRHHYRWRAAKFRPMLGAQGLSLSCHTCCDTGPRFFRSHRKDRPIQSPFTTHEGMWRIYSNPDPHGSRPTMKAHFLALVHFVAHNIAFEMNNNECVRIHSVLLLPFLCTAVYWQTDERGLSVKFLYNLDKNWRWWNMQNYHFC